MTLDDFFFKLFGGEIDQYGFRIERPPLVLDGYGKEEEWAKKVLIKNYKGYGIYYYYGDGFKYHEGSFKGVGSFAQSIGSNNIGLYVSSGYDDYFGHGINIAVFNNDKSSHYNKYPLHAIWIRHVIDTIDEHIKCDPEDIEKEIEKAVKVMELKIDEEIHSSYDFEKRFYGIKAERSSISDWIKRNL